MKLLLLLLALSDLACRAPQAEPRDVPPVASPVRATAVPRPTPPKAFKVFGYHAWWMREQWQGYDLGLLDRLMFFELRVTPEGGFEDRYGWPDQWQALRTQAQARGVSVVPTVAVLDARLFVSLLTSEAAARQLRENTMAVVREAGAEGVHLNFEVFEPVPAAAQEGLTQFVTRLKADLVRYRPQAQLTLFIPAFDHGEAYDEVALAAACDYLVVQGYDLHWLTAPEAGPVAPLTGWNGANWQGILDRYLALGVPRSKIIMTVPYFGYEWPTASEQPGAATRGQGQPLTFAPVDPAYLPLIQISAQQRTQAHGLRRDPVSGSPYYAYRATDGWYQGWFEDAQSLRAKYDFIRRERLAGIAIFLLGYDGGQLDPVLRQALVP